MALRVLLGELPVGRIQIEGDAIVFTFEPAYLQTPRRPVLGRWFEDLPPSAATRLTEGARLPSFFRNCLPEGALRKLLEGDVAMWVHRDYHLLRRLGEDLPGNIRVLDDALEPDLRLPGEVADVPGVQGSHGLRFSLAGLQPKLSVLVEEDKVTLPARGRGGRWMLKLPTRTHPQLPVNEFYMLRWAARVGLVVPEHRLVSAVAIDDLPASFQPVEPTALVVRRFDRDGDRRVHLEDFCQVLGLPPVVKFRGETQEDYGSLGRIIHAVCGAQDFQEYLHRLVFMVLSGNTDAHLKNWSFWYPDPCRPRLSPAYDLVCTVAYPDAEHYLALFFDASWAPAEFHDPAATLDPTRVTPDDFARLVDRAGEPSDHVADDVRGFSRRCRLAWRALREDPAMPAFLRDALDRHLAAIPW